MKRNLFMVGLGLLALIPISKAVFAADGNWLKANASSPTAHMATTTETWQGSGSIYTPGGAMVDTYKIEVVESINGSNIDSQTTVTLSDGSTRNFSQKIKVQGNGWTSESGLGHGGGACYGNDVCQNYLADDKGNAYATVTFRNGESERQDLTTVLSNGQATQVLRDKLTRVR